MQTYTHQASGKELSKPLLQPHVESWSDCFVLSKPYDLWGKKPHAFAPSVIRCKSLAAAMWAVVESVCHNKQPERNNLTSVQIGPFCSVESNPSMNRYFDVVCADWVLSRISESGFVIPNTPISFEVIDHKNGWSLVLATMGGYTPFWLAYIRNETIPQVQLPE